MSADLIQRAVQPPPTFESPKPVTLQAKLWAATWPKLLAVGIAVGVWQLVVWSGWKPEFLLPGPGETFGRLWEEMTASDGRLWEALATTIRRGVFGFLIAL